MPHTSLERLNILLQQCNDKKNINPVTNKYGCIDCLQAVFTSEKGQCNIADLGLIIRKLWFEFDKDTFFQALRGLRRQDGSQAFSNQQIDAEVKKYFNKIVNFRHKERITNPTGDYAHVSVGTIGLNGRLTKMVISTRLSDQGTGNTDGSAWSVRIIRSGMVRHEFMFPIHMPDHVPQIITDAVRIDGLPIELLSTDLVQVCVYQIHQAHYGNLDDTSVDFYMDPIV